MGSRVISSVHSLCGATLWKRAACWTISPASSNPNPNLKGEGIWLKSWHSSSHILYKNDMLEHSGDEGVDTGAPRSDWALLSAPPTVAWRIDSEQYRCLTACNQASLLILYHNGRP